MLRKLSSVLLLANLLFDVTDEVASVALLVTQVQAALRIVSCAGVPAQFYFEFVLLVTLHCVLRLLVILANLLLSFKRSLSYSWQTTACFELRGTSKELQSLFAATELLVCCRLRVVQMNTLHNKRKCLFVFLREKPIHADLRLLWLSFYLNFP